MFLQKEDKIALILAYREFISEGSSIEDYKEKYEYVGGDHLIALELGYLLDCKYSQLTNSILLEMSMT